jgi:hypothetical protein
MRFGCSAVFIYFPSYNLVKLLYGVMGGGADCLSLDPPSTIVSMNVFFKSTKSLLKRAVKPSKMYFIGLFFKYLQLQALNNSASATLEGTRFSRQGANYRLT